MSSVAADSVIEANVQLRGRTRVGTGCRIGTGSVLRSCDIGDDVNILPYVVAEASTIRSKASVGPFSRLRMNAEADEGSLYRKLRRTQENQIRARFEGQPFDLSGRYDRRRKRPTSAPGTITCNYDGQKKHQTSIGEGAFVGSNSTLVAPVTIGEGAYTAAGSVITKDVAQDALAIGRARQEEKPGWAAAATQGGGISVDEELKGELAFRCPRNHRAAAEFPAPHRHRSDAYNARLRGCAA